MAKLKLVESPQVNKKRIGRPRRGTRRGRKNESFYSSSMIGSSQDDENSQEYG